MQSDWPVEVTNQKAVLRYFMMESGVQCAMKTGI